jgi:ABC-type transport system involved in multi-copper enzyme maturation permease subunit
MTGFSLWQQQVLTIVSLEWRKTLFNRRGAWIYLLALFPAFLYLMVAINSQNRQAARSPVDAVSPNAAAVIAQIQPGIKLDDAIALLKENNIRFNHFSRGDRRQFIHLSDGERRLEFRYLNGVMTERRDRSMPSLNDNIRAFAGIFQYFFLRLAIFFGCVGIFMNLFRGEMLDQSLHHYLLAPVRREVLMVGKYLAGLVATIMVFGLSTTLQFFLMLYAHPANERAAYLAGPGWGHFLAYLGVTALGCAGYGSLFLAAGLIMKNPLIAASLVLFWEGANWFLPTILKQFSIIYYLQALCPVVAALSADIPEPLKLLVTTAAPIPGAVAVLGLFAVCMVVLTLAGFAVRKLEINYGAD